MDLESDGEDKGMLGRDEDEDSHDDVDERGRRWLLSLATQLYC